MKTNYNEEHIDFRNFLKKKIAKRQEINPQYSLRSFARHAGISQSFLSQVLSGKKNVSEKTALKLIQSLRLENEEGDLLLKMIEFATARSSTKDHLKNDIISNLMNQNLSTKNNLTIEGAYMFTGKLTKLRAHEETDGRDLSELFHDDYEICYNNNPKLILPVSKEVEEDFFKTESDSEISFAIENLKDNKFIGYTYIYNINNKNRICFFETILAKEYRNVEFESDVAIILLNFIFNELNMRKLVLPLLSYDSHSLEVYSNLGFNQEAVHKEEFFRNGKYYDKVYLTFFQKDFHYQLNTKDLSIIKK